MRPSTPLPATFTLPRRYQRHQTSITDPHGDPLMNRRPSLRRPSRSNPRRAAAFTLLEMMLVVAIMGILMSVAVWNIVGQSEKARVKATEATMQTIETALKAYKADKGSYPQTIQMLVTTKMLDERIKDAWKHDIEYRTPGANGRDYSLVSPGPDGQIGTDDDIDVWRMREEAAAAN
jgi:general secretion pathway protein G